MRGTNKKVMEAACAGAWEEEEGDAHERMNELLVSVKHYPENKDR